MARQRIAACFPQDDRVGTWPGSIPATGGVRLGRNGASARGELQARRGKKRAHLDTVVGTVPVQGRITADAVVQVGLATKKPQPVGQGLPTHHTQALQTTAQLVDRVVQFKIQHTPWRGLHQEKDREPGPGVYRQCRHLWGPDNVLPGHIPRNWDGSIP